ncbi:hypothetical protein T484DRAFT_1931705 [Baffinella frigidus]|nr:hypothetical protein T484DRAFT_1931705 [Cryptophyta sp. CCMP2293]
MPRWGALEPMAPRPSDASQWLQGRVAPANGFKVERPAGAACALTALRRVLPVPRRA